MAEYKVNIPIIALCGRKYCGKSTLAQYWSTQGYTIYNSIQSIPKISDDLSKVRWVINYLVTLDDYNLAIKNGATVILINRDISTMTQDEINAGANETDYLKMKPIFTIQNNGTDIPPFYQQATTQLNNWQLTLQKLLGIN